MPPVSPQSEHPELFRSALVNLVDRRHPLVRLAGLIDWERSRDRVELVPTMRGIVGREERDFSARRAAVPGWGP